MFKQYLYIPGTLMDLYENLPNIFSSKKKQNETIYYDFETTGLNPFYSKIIEYAFLRQNNNELITSLVYPGMKITKKITEITGIQQKDLVGQPLMVNKIFEIIKFLDKSEKNVYLVAHNNDGFDKWFFKTALNEYTDIRFNKYKYIDTLILSKMLLPDRWSHSMKSLCEYFKIKLNAHRANEDTQALRLVYHKLLEKLSDRIYIEKETLINDPSIVYDYIYS